jgi:membrane protease YdiL (CAAX protease family)
MSIPALLVRFTVIYVVLLVLIAVALNALGIKGNSGVNTAALLGAVMWTCFSFASKNKRYFSKEEKTRVVLGMLKQVAKGAG